MLERELVLLPPVFAVFIVAVEVAFVVGEVWCRAGEAYVGDPVNEVPSTPKMVCARPGLMVNAPPP